MNFLERLREPFLMPTDGGGSGGGEKVKPVRRILVVDDDPGLREFITMVLEAQGHQITQARDGEEALGLITQAPPSTFNLVISDVQMPRMSGLELLAKLQELHASGRKVPPVLIGSAQLDLGFLNGKPEVAGVLRKPFELDAFMKQVEECMRTNDGSGISSF